MGNLETERNEKYQRHPYAPRYVLLLLLSFFLSSSSTPFGFVMRGKKHSAGVVARRDVCVLFDPGREHTLEMSR